MSKLNKNSIIEQNTNHQVSKFTNSIDNMSLGSDKGIAGQAQEDVSPSPQKSPEMKQESSEMKDSKDELKVRKKRSMRSTKSPKKIGKIGSPKMSALIGNGEIPKKKSSIKSTS